MEMDNVGKDGTELEGSSTKAAAIKDSLDKAANAINNTFFPYYQHSLYVAASYVLAYLSIFLLCMVGNILVCLIVLKNRRMRTVINLFILNLAISDLLVGIFCIPTTLVDNLITGLSGPLPFGPPLFTVTGAFAGICRKVKLDSMVRFLYFDPL